MYNHFTDLFKVCIERKVFEEDGAEEASAEEESGNGRRSKFFAMDMSFTSCRDDFNFHECSSQINRYVIYPFDNDSLLINEKIRKNQISGPKRLVYKNTNTR